MAATRSVLSAAERRSYTLHVGELDLRYQYAQPRVVHENFEDETVIVNLDNGAYYSLNAAGRSVWMMLGAGMSVSEIMDAARGAPQQARQAIEGFVGTLRQDGLLEPRHAASPVEKISFSFGTDPPRIEKFTDMERLILLDVIHDVDETGWPVLADRESGVEPSTR